MKVAFCRAAATRRPFAARRPPSRRFALPLSDRRQLPSADRSNCRWEPAVGPLNFASWDNSHQFSYHVLMSIVAKGMNGSRCHRGRPRLRPHCVRWGPSSSSPEGAEQLPQFSAHVCCGQWAGWIKMSLGMDYGGRPRPWPHCVRWGPSPCKGAQPPNFRPMTMWPNGWIDQDAIWYEGRPRPRRHCVRWGPSSPPKRGHRFLFWSVSIMAKR